MLARSPQSRECDDEKGRGECSANDRCGDYASGTNHTLPTNGYARQFSGVNTLSFQKHITSQELTKDGLRLLGPTVIELAEREGLEAHANAVRVRLAELN